MDIPYKEHIYTPVYTCGMDFGPGCENRTKNYKKGRGAMEVQELDGITFFYYSDIVEELSPVELEEFDSWFYGQTGIIGPYGLGVYTWDWEKFLRRNKPRKVSHTRKSVLDTWIDAEIEIGD